MSTPHLNRWKSGDKVIQASKDHKDLFIINHADGTWHAVASSQELMQTKYPPHGTRRAR